MNARQFPGSLGPLLVLLAICINPSGVHGQASKTPEPLWQDAPAGLTLRDAGREPWVRPSAFRTCILNESALADVLSRTPLETLPPAKEPVNEVLTLPMPDGTYARFQIVESPIMEPELAARFPQIKTYAGRGIDDPAATLRLDRTPAGLHAQVLSPSGAVYIDPRWRGNTAEYLSYYKRDFQAAKNWTCGTPSGDQAAKPGAAAAPTPLLVSGTTLRTYRLACAATGEYTAFHGGTVTAALSAIATTVNRVTGVYERDLAIRLVLVANNNLVVYTNSNTDPYTNNNGSTMLGQNQSNLDGVIGSANYDIGHVFSTGGGGIAGLGVVCVNNNKARGVTGSPSPVGDAFDIDYVAHEMGHQFGANHTFNGTTNNCGGGNRNPSTAYEPGSGSTIMAYAGICGSDDLQPHSDPYFHSASLDEIVSYTTGGSGSGCAVGTATGNTPPLVSAGPDYTIPYGTPFTLTASGSDANADPLTYCWEQRDLGPAATLGASDEGSIPLFRSFNPVASPSRTFPRLETILASAPSLSEKLPTAGRAMDFRVVARDNRAGGGGVHTDDMIVNVTAAAGPFAVTSPNTAVTWSGLRTVTWNVAGTSASPVNTASVDILLSADGGITFPTALAAGTPNDGSQAVTLPDINTSTARIKVQAVGNIYFDISNVNFTIMPALPVQFTATGVNVVADTTGNGNANGRLDPGENDVHLTLQLRNDGASTATGVSAVLSSITPMVSVLANSSAYPDLPVGAVGNNATDFVISVSAGFLCGSPITLRLAVSANEGSHPVDFEFPTGTVGAPVTVSYTGPALAIPDQGTLNVSLPVSSVGLIADVNFRFDGASCSTNQNATTVGLNHSYVGDLVITLISPAGTQVTLASQPGLSSGNNFCQTLFDDDGAFPSIQSITSASAPHTGTWLPAGPLSAFDGQSADGTWTLRVQDVAAVDTGSVRSFSLIFTPLQCSAPLLNIPGDFNGDGDADADDILQFLSCMTGPGLGPAAPACQKGLLDADPDIDQIDFGLIQRCMTAPSVTGDPHCAD